MNPFRRIVSQAAMPVLLLCSFVPAEAQTTRDTGVLARSGASLDFEQPGATTWPPPLPASGAGMGCSTRLVGSGNTYDVGPGQTFEELTQVPWLSLQPGDVVNIHHRPTPYRTKFGLRAQGTVAAPVVINGVTDARCRRPEISGRDAVTAEDAVRSRYFSKEHSEHLGLIFIYKAPSDPWTHKPRNIVIQNLHLSGAHKRHNYVAQDGSAGAYSLGASAIYAVRVEGLTVQDNEVTDNGNGVFVNSRDDDDYSGFVTLRRNRLWGNGNVGSYTEHNLYIQAVRPLYEGNLIGQLRPGAVGSSMKDRSSGSVIRFNRIEAAARAIDLVEIEGGVRPVRDDPLYDHAWVYGNLIVSDHDSAATASTLIIHWGGDNDPRYFRKGTLYFFNNTVVTRATEAQAYYLTVFDLPTTDQRVEVASNVFLHLGSSRFNVAYKSGTIVLRDTNWFTRGWARSWGREVLFKEMDAQSIEGDPKELDSTFVPRPTSRAVDRGARVPPSHPGPAAADNLRPSAQFSAPAGWVERKVRGKGIDLGAFEAP